MLCTTSVRLNGTWQLSQAEVPTYRCASNSSVAPAPTAAAVVSPVPATTRTPSGSPKSAATAGSTVPTTLAGRTSSGSRRTSRPQRSRQGRVPDDRGRVAVVGAPAQDRRVPAGDRATGEPHGEVLGHVEQPHRCGIHLGALVAQPGRLPHRVLAGAGRHPARPRQPVPQGPRVVAPGHPQAAAGELLGVPAAARVHPGQGRVHVPTVGVDRHQPAPLAAHADGGDPPVLSRMPVAQTAARRQDRSPPVVGVLLGATARQQPQLDGLLLVGDEHTVGARERDPGPPGAEVDAEDEAGHRARVRCAGRSRRHGATRRGPAAGVATTTPGHGEEGERPEGEVGVADDDLHDEHEHRPAEVAGEQQEPGGRGGALGAGRELGPVQGDGQPREQEEPDDRERDRDQPDGRQHRDQREGDDGEHRRGEQHRAALVAAGRRGRAARRCRPARRSSSSR